MFQKGAHREQEAKELDKNMPNDEEWGWGRLAGFSPPLEQWKRQRSKGESSFGPE